METVEHSCLENAGRDLRRSDHHAGEHGLGRRCSERFYNARQVRGHRGSYGPGGGECERQEDHGAVERNMRFDDPVPRALCPFGSREEQQVERQAKNDVGGRPAVARARQPIVSRPSELSGQPTVLANPAIRVMPVIALRALSP